MNLAVLRLFRLQLANSPLRFLDSAGNERSGRRKPFIPDHILGGAGHKQMR